VTWDSPDDIFYGTALSGTQLNAVGSVPGTLTYSPVSGTVLSAGEQTLHVDFTPTDSTNYTSSSVDVTLTVNNASTTITWSSPESIVYGTALSSTQLNANAGGVSGTFVYTPASGTILPAGANNLHVTFTPTDNTNYSSSTKDVPITVTKATPTITWDNPADITYGTALGGTQLDAESTTSGSFVYSP
jgi:hypothetical protein